MNTPDYLRHMPDGVVTLMDRFSSSVVEDMARRMIRVGVDTSSLRSFQKLREAGYLAQDVLESLRTTLGVGGDNSRLLSEVMDAFAEAATRSVEFDNTLYRAAGRMPNALFESDNLMRILRIGAENTNEEMVNLTRTTVATVQSSFIQSLDVAYMQVSSNTMSASKAIVQAIRRVAEDGAHVLYPSGHEDTIEVATRRALLTGVNQTVAKIQMENLRMFGEDYVEVSAHFGARNGEGINNHIGWQGGVYRVSDGELERVTGYGQLLGLCGINCNHSFSPFFPGISEPAYTEEVLREMEEAKVVYNGREIPRYRAQQRQRRYEREIRATKRQLSGYLAAMEEAAKTNGFKARQELEQQFTLDSLLLRRQRDKLGDFEKQTGLLPQTERQQVYGFGRSEASKASWAARKAM